MIDIPVFKQEVEDNLKDLIKSKFSVNYLTELQDCEPFDLSETVINTLKASQETETFDLAFKKSILVSTIWNANDDYFDPLEVWTARYSAKDKPFNIEHESEVIIGHMLESYPITEEGNLIQDDISVDELPKKYHIVSKNVIYKWWREEKKRNQIEQILQQIAKKEWFVSVESLFSGFDYALLDVNNNLKIVCRTKETSFLTKHLRIYGGSGVYQDYRIGRVPRNITFSGIGLVRRPANAESVIFSKKYDFDSIISEDLVYLQSNIMEKNMEKELENKISQLSKDLEAALANLTNEKETNKGLSLKVSDLEKELATSLSTIEENKKAVDNIQKIKDELETKFTESVKNLSVASETIAKFESEKVKTNRLSLVATKLSLDNDKANKLVEDLIDLNDEKFNSHLEILASFKTEKVTKEVLEKVEEGNKEPSLSLNHDNGVDNSVVDSISKFLESSRK